VAQQQTDTDNQERDRWMYEQKSRGIAIWQIQRELVSAHPEWYPLETSQGVSNAIDRYAKRHGLPNFKWR
jgi:hypothetical protein